MTSGPKILCLDLGTSACKGALIDAQGRTSSAARESYDLIYEPNGWVEQDPEVIWSAVARVVAQLAASGEEIAALSFSAQMSSHLLAGENGRPLTRFISWADQRAERESRELAEAFSPDFLAAAWGAQLIPGPSWALPKLKWWRRNAPALLDAAKYLLQPKDWILGRLCGSCVSDLSSLRGLCHQQTGLIDAKLAHWARFDPALVPQFLAPDAIAGEVLPALARQWNLPPHLPVVVGWNDLASGVLGSTGFPNSSIGFDLTGTSEHLGVVAPRFAESSPEFTLHEIPLGLHHRARYGVTSSSGRALTWYWEQLRQQSAKLESYQLFDAEAASIAPCADGLLFLPCLDGERAPWFNPRTRGTFFGISASHSPAHFSRAVLEGIAFTLRSIQQRLGVELPSEYRLAGGAGAMSGWNQIKADILGVRLTTLESNEAGCLGAAILAAKALGWSSSWHDAASKMVRVARTCQPNEKRASRYREQHAQFEKLYFALEPLFGLEPPKENP